MRCSFLIAFVLLLFNCTPNKTQSITLVSTAEKHLLQDVSDVKLVDVRTVAEYNKGHIANAINVDFYSPTFIKELAILDKNSPVIVYCRSGGRSASASKKMKEAGFKTIYDLKGGFLEWQNADLIIK